MEKKQFQIQIRKNNKEWRDYMFPYPEYEAAYGEAKKLGYIGYDVRIIVEVVTQLEVKEIMEKIIK